MHRRLLLPLGLLWAFSGAFFGASPGASGPAIAAGPERAPVWIAFGDSLTNRVRPASWVALVSRATHHPIQRAGIIGGTSAYAVSVLEDQVLSRHPDLVFVMFGVNDQQIPNDGAPDGYLVPPEQYAANLDTIVTRIQVQGAQVVLMTNRPLIQGPAGDGASYYLDRHGDKGALYTLPGHTKGSIRLYNDIVRAKAREHGTFLVDIWQAIVDRAGSDRDEDVRRLNLELRPSGEDGVHLGPEGARFFARTILSAMPFRPVELPAAPPPP